MEKLRVSSSPHIHTPDSVSGIMLDVIIALIPCVLAGILTYGINAALLITVCVISAVLSEYIWCICLKKPVCINDLSAVVTGIILALSLSSALPLWMGAIGSAVAIIVVKQFFGGLGHNFANPAATARIILLVSFPAYMSVYYEPFSSIVSSATPLADSTVPLKTLLLGGHAGCIGEGFPLLILVGGLYLVIRRVISPTIPLCYILSAFVLTFILSKNAYTSLCDILGGGLVFGAVFMATDYTTSPKSFWGQVIFGTGLGILTTVIRRFGAMPEGSSYAILLMNILVPHINTLTLPKPFGYKEAKNNG